MGANLQKNQSHAHLLNHLKKAHHPPLNPAPQSNLLKRVQKSLHQRSQNGAQISLHQRNQNGAQRNLDPRNLNGAQRNLYQRNQNGALKSQKKRENQNGKSRRNQKSLRRKGKSQKNQRNPVENLKRARIRLERAEKT